MIDVYAEIDTLVNLAWDTSIDDDTRDGMVSHFSYLDLADWEKIKERIKCSDSVQRVIDTIDTLRDLNASIN